MTDRTNPPRPVLMHVMQCEGGGAPVALASRVHAMPWADHHILWPCGNDHLLGPDTANITRHPLPDGVLSQFTQTRRLTEALRPDVVWAHSSFAGLYTRAARIGAPVIYEPHGWAFNYPHWSTAKRAAFRAVERLLAPRTAAAAVLTDADAVTAARLGLHNITLAPLTSRAATTRTRTGAPTVIMAGRVAPVKDPAFYAAVATAVTGRLPGTRFVWAGGGDPDLEQTLTGAGVEVSGWVDQQQVWDLMGGADLYVHTATSEGFPVTVTDAAGLGLPTLLRDIPAFSGLPGRRPSSVAGMVEAICRFFTEHDPAPAETSAAIAEASSPHIHACALRRIVARAVPGLVAEHETVQR